jgi:hypothetical protein
MPIRPYSVDAIDVEAKRLSLGEDERHDAGNRESALR